MHLSDSLNGPPADLQSVSLASRQFSSNVPIINYIGDKPRFDALVLKGGYRKFFLFFHKSRWA